MGNFHIRKELIITDWDECGFYFESEDEADTVAKILEVSGIKIETVKRARGLFCVVIDLWKHTPEEVRNIIWNVSDMTKEELKDVLDKWGSIEMTKNEALEIREEVDILLC